MLELNASAMIKLLNKLSKLTFILFFISSFSYAGLFKLINVAGQGAVDNTQAKVIADLVSNEINKNLPSANDQSDFFKGMSNANTISAAGMTTSYASVYKNFLLGLNASAGADLGSKNFTDFKNFTQNPEQFKGFGFQAAIILGLNAKNLFNISWLETHPLNIYLSGFGMNRNFKEVTAKYFGAGIGIQYKIISEKSWGAKSLKWTGLDLSSGFIYSKLDAGASISLDDKFTVDSNGTTFDVTVSNAAALLNANVKTFSIPLEISSGVRLLYTLKLVGGVGADISLGSTSGTGSLSPGNSINASKAGNGMNAVGELNLDGSKEPDFINPRFFFGPQVEFGVGSVFATLHKSLNKNTIAVNSGINFFW
jgi:hypothetical protein